MCLTKKFNASLVRNNTIKPFQSILICISGGQDSVSLYYLFKQIQRFWNWRIGIIYCDHLIHTKSIFNAYTIQKLVKSSPFEYYEIVSTKTLVSEVKARNWRYKKILKIAYHYGFSYIATGHTKNDRIETFFLIFLEEVQLKDFILLTIKLN